MSTAVGDFLAHYGVKGMKWGVRRDEEMMGRIAGYKARGESAETKARYKEYKKTTSRKQRKADKAAVIESRAQALLDDAMKNPLNIMEVGTPGYPTLMEGKEFVEMLSRGGVFNPMTTHVTDMQFDRGQG
jgi:hypothetical protein